MLLSHMHGAELFLISSGRGAFVNVNVSQSLPLTCQLCDTKSCVDVRSTGNISVNSQLAGSRLVPVTCMLQLVFQGVRMQLKEIILCRMLYLKK